jgi:hypothetical protein
MKNIIKAIRDLKIVQAIHVTPSKMKLQPVAVSLSTSLARQYADRVRGAPGGVYRH